MKPTRPSEPMEAFGARIRALRRGCGMTQQAVADRLQIHRTTYTKYEIGCVTPDQQGLVRLAEIFGVTVDRLLGRDEIIVADGTDSTPELTPRERILLQMFRQLTDAQQRELVSKAQAAFKKRYRQP